LLMQGCFFAIGRSIEKVAEFLSGSNLTAIDVVDTASKIRR
jgi:hypothetical protein